MISVGKTIWRDCYGGNRSISFANFAVSEGRRISVAVINPLEMKRYRCQGIRNAKTDEIDVRIISNYGIDFWYRLSDFETRDEVYVELRLLGCQYRQYMNSGTLIT